MYSFFHSSPRARRDAHMSKRPSRRADMNRRGFTLIEIMVSALLIVIIFSAWFKISNFQAIRKESLRREAVERAAGYLDVMTRGSYMPGYYRVDPVTAGVLSVGSGDEIQALFDSAGPVGYVLQVHNFHAGLGSNWPPSSVWATVQLFNQHGISANTVRPYYELSLCIR